jgi:hypothetical protein
MSIYVDSDSHLLEPNEIAYEYVPAKYRDLTPQVVERDGVAYLKIEGRVFDELPIAAASVPNGLSDLEKTLHNKWEDVPAGAKEPKARLEVLNTEGLTATVLYPTIGLLYAGIRDHQVAAATCEGYNRWVADFCKTDQRRLCAVGTIPLQDVDLALRELEHIAKLGLCGATIRPTPYNGRRLNDPAYDRFWAAAQDLNLPVAMHGSFAVDTISSVASDRYPNSDLFSATSSAIRSSSRWLRWTSFAAAYWRVTRSFGSRSSRRARDGSSTGSIASTDITRRWAGWCPG